MNKKEFEVFEKKLLERGYRKWYNQFDHSDYNLYKSFRREDNKFDEDRAAYQLFLRVYDYTLKDWPNLPKDMRDHIGIEIAVMVSRVIDERLDLTVPFKDSDTIEAVEELAESFYKWVETVYPEPRKF